mmetsp:Transcript_29744/g.70124  ORF Transcript_29744/g.70124 Transcript_29744/m.70124 type:complete len:99 (+) Transcript_29744:123-419(+)
MPRPLPENDYILSALLKVRLDESMASGFNILPALGHQVQAALKAMRAEVCGSLVWRSIRIHASSHLVLTVLRHWAPFGYVQLCEGPAHQHQISQCRFG